MSLSTPAPAARTLHFPAGPTTAKLTTFGGGTPRQTLALQDTMEVPEGARAMLELNGAELDLLSQLAAGDLDGLTVHAPTLRFIAAIRSLGLSTLTLAGACPAGVIAELNGLAELSMFTLQDAPLDAESAEALTGLSQLDWLRVMGESNDAVAAAACRLTGLTYLTVISDTPLGEGFAAIGDLTQLVQLALMFPEVGDGVVGRLGALADLHTLMLGTSGIRGDSLGILAALPRLNFLAIQSPEFDLGSLELLTASGSLTQLSVGGVSNIDDSVAVQIAELSPPLTKVSLYGDGESAGLSVSAQVWLKRSRPELSVNGFDPSEKALAKYLAAGLGNHPVTGGPELAP